jgi:hypothetical protein
LQIVVSKRGAAPSFFRSLRKRKADAVAKGQLIRLRKQTVSQPDRSSEQHEHEAAP